MRKWDAVKLSNADQIATALRPLTSGETVQVRFPDDIVTINVSDDIPICHKFALQQISSGEKINKYGEHIGAASKLIRVGQHVHIHNLKSLRATLTKHGKG
ncbi:MAG: UxaA family hydrolase [Methyloligellaceae bacterium]